MTNQSDTVNMTTKNGMANIATKADIVKYE